MPSSRTPSHLYCVHLCHISLDPLFFSLFFFFNDTATTEIYTLSLHDALPISGKRWPPRRLANLAGAARPRGAGRSILPIGRDRKSTRLNSSHQIISYAVFCLKKKKTKPVKIDAQCTFHGALQR